MASTVASEPERRARTLFVGAVLAIAVGLAAAGSIDRTLGGVVTLGGWLVSVYALHRLGRVGARA